MIKPGENPRVLIVDDDPAYLQDEVDALGFDCTAVCDLVGLKKELDRVKNLRENIADVAPAYCAYIIDLCLGSDSGFDAMKCIREWEVETGLDHMPFIVYSGFTDFDFSEVASLCPNFYVVNKAHPADFEAVLMSLDHAHQIKSL